MNSTSGPPDLNSIFVTAKDWGERLWGGVSNSVASIPTLGMPADVREAWQKFTNALSQEPEKASRFQATLKAEQERLMRLMSTSSTDDAQSFSLSMQDKRFSGAAWQTQPQFRMLAESYLSTSRLMLSGIDMLDGSPTQKQRMRFFVKQYLDAVSPANFLATNPEAIAAAVESKGESLRQSFSNLQEDAAKGHISMTDESAFVVGKNIAVTSGSVVFENDIFQLLQYAPQTAQVHLRPLLMVPPCINKFYILDLRPDNSFIEYAVQQGFTVFVISWRNVQAAQGMLTWDDYLRDGVIKAIDVTRLISNVEKLNLLGFCVGGTLLACALAVLRRLEQDVVESATFLTTFLDFSDVGDIAAYVDEAFVEKREREVGLPAGGGIINGSELAFAFSSLRANELVWNYVANNYLQGKKPPPFDLLFWNGDSTNLPGPWYTYYLRNTYFENNLVKPDKLTMCGVPVDLSYVDMPTFVFAAREDHIVPWRTAYASVGYLGGSTEFVLGASGHIAGVVNPASKNKRSYWADAVKGGSDLPADANNWVANATEVTGSWWPYWSQWLAKRSGRMIGASQRQGSAAYPVIEAAPGRYVQAKN
jgi:polyhydroxyalkanoate synthase subunit PhaC